jgi:hypothetical protein
VRDLEPGKPEEILAHLQPALLVLQTPGPKYPSTESRKTFKEPRVYTENKHSKYQTPAIYV